MNLPIIRIELEHIRQQVSVMLSDHNKELNAYVAQSIENQLNEKWVMQQIDREVKNAIENAVKEISNNYFLRSAITSVISETIAKKLGSTKL